MLKWMSFGSQESVKSSNSVNFEVLENTQCSVDLMTEIDHHFAATKGNINIIADGITMVHEQGMEFKKKKF